MSSDVDTTLLRRHIGRWLAQLRVTAGLTQRAAAQELGRQVLHVHRIETGYLHVTLRKAEIAALCDLYQAGSEAKEQLVALAEATRETKRSWVHDYTESALPVWFGLYVTLEQGAERIRRYESESVPGLLQTRSYAEAVTGLPAGTISAEEVAQRVSVRLKRQDLLTRPQAPHLDAIVNESVLRRQVGGPQVMAAQLRHLLEMTVRNSVSLRVLPWTAGAHAAMNSPFTVLDFPPPRLSTEPSEPPLAYVDTLTGAFYLTKPNEVAAYERAWADLEKRVLDAAASREMITRAMEDLSD